MHFRGLDLNLLVALDALLTERSITQAGERLNLSQSGMSGALGRLRDYFKDDLLIQVGRNMVPTPLGLALGKPVREILTRVRTTIEVRPRFDPAISQRKFTLMMSDYAAIILMPEVARRIHNAAPGITLEIIANSDKPAETLDRGTVDFLVIIPSEISDYHPSVELFQDDFVCAVWAENPEIEHSLSLEQYWSMGHVAVQFGRGNRLAGEFQSPGPDIARRVEVTAMNFESVPRYLPGTRRVGTIPRRIGELYQKELSLKLLPTPIKIEPIVETLQWHRSRESDPGSLWVRTSILATAERLKDLSGSSV